MEVLEDPLTPVCPYCGDAIYDPSEDHIFSKFLGGRRTIPVCNKFGESFEGRYSQALLQIKTWLTVSGIPLKWHRDFEWKRALDHNGASVDLIVRDGKILVAKSKPEIIRNEQGKPVQVLARSVPEIKKIISGLTRKNIASPVSEPKSEFFSVKIEDFEFDIDMGPDVGKLCLKMCSAATTLLPDFDPTDIVSAVTALHHQETRLLCGVALDDRTHEHLDAARPPLAHLIYVESTGEGIFGVVQFFGALQFHCRLGTQRSYNSKAALMGVLNSITGEESFCEVDSFNLSALPTTAVSEEKWAAKLSDQMRLAGCSVSGVQLTFKPSLNPLFESSTTGVWPFGQIPCHFAKSPKYK